MTDDEDFNRIMENLNLNDDDEIDPLLKEIDIRAKIVNLPTIFKDARETNDFEGLNQICTELEEYSRNQMTEWYPDAMKKYKHIFDTIDIFYKEATKPFHLELIYHFSVRLKTIIRVKYKRQN